MDNKEFALTVRDLAERINVGGESLCLFEQALRSVPPGISIDSERVLLPDESEDSSAIGFPEILTERIQLNIQTETINYLRRDPDLLAKLVDRMSKRITADLRLAIYYGITSYRTISLTRDSNERVLPPLIHIE